MSTGTEHVPDATHPADADRATTWVVIVSIVATLAVAWSLVLAYGYTAQNGADLASAPGLMLTFLVSLVPALLAAWAIHLVSVRSDGRRVSFLVIAPICLLVMMGGVALLATFGGRAYDDRQAVITAACSTQDVEVLGEFAQYGGEFTGPEGTDEGACNAHLILPGEDGQSLMASLTTAMEADGWTTSDTAWNDRTYTRGSDVVRVTHARSSEGSTAIRITIVDQG